MAERKPVGIAKYRELSKTELETRQGELSEQIFRLRFQLSTGQAEGLKKLREAKRDLARGSRRCCARLN
jgi:large subunit ribosomal protein L29